MVVNSAARYNANVRFLTAGLILLATTQPALPPAQAPKRIEARQLTLTSSQSQLATAAGGRVSLLVDVVPKTKMHVYAPEQKGGYIRIDLALDAQPAIKAAKPVFPKASDYYFAPLGETFKVFDAPFRIRQDVTVTQITRPLTITGTLRYQACDDLVCYRPDQVKLSWTIVPARPAR